MVIYKTAVMSSYREGFPSKFFIEFDLASVFPAASSNYGCLILNHLNHVHEVRGTVMEYDVPVFKMRADVHCVS